MTAYLLSEKLEEPTATSGSGAPCYRQLEDCQGNHENVLFIFVFGSVDISCTMNYSIILENFKWVKLTCIEGFSFRASLLGAFWSGCSGKSTTFPALGRIAMQVCKFRTLSLTLAIVKIKSLVNRNKSKLSIARYFFQDCLMRVLTPFCRRVRFELHILKYNTLLIFSREITIDFRYSMDYFCQRLKNCFSFI